MKPKKNILFIMYDQLRFDYLSYAGHKTLKTPNFDRVSTLGVNFTNAYVQSPVCGASRMSTYTGRYVSSHGASWNKFPLRVGEITLGDHLRKLGMDCWLLGKTHMEADEEGMERLGIEKDSLIGVRQAECGFDPWVRDDGLYGSGPSGDYGENDGPYNRYLKSKGYDGENPWADYANAGISDKQIASGWMFRNADKAANIKEEDSETPWLTQKTIEFVDQAEGPWMAHVSYIKPHWPYIVPAPYHNMFGANHVPGALRHEIERQDPHPVYGAYMGNKIASAFQREEVREKVIPAYMGLIKQCDDQLGRLLDHLENTGRMADTMIVLTSDHGDYLGDHWLGEKDLFHDVSVKVPLILYHPDSEFDISRGTICDALVEQIDLAPTFVEIAGGEIPIHILEGKSLVPLLRGERPESWREFVISEYDYSITPMRKVLNLETWQSRLFMVFDGRYKLMHSAGKHRPMLFDLLEDPSELNDIGDREEYNQVIRGLYKQLSEWSIRMAQRVTMSEKDIIKKTGGALKYGILVGVHKESDLSPEVTARYTGLARQIHFENQEDIMRYGKTLSVNKKDHI